MCVCKKDVQPAVLAEPCLRLPSPSTASLDRREPSRVDLRQVPLGRLHRMNHLMTQLVGPNLSSVMSSVCGVWKDLNFSESFPHGGLLS